MHTFLEKTKQKSKLNFVKLKKNMANSKLIYKTNFCQDKETKIKINIKTQTRNAKLEISTHQNFINFMIASCSRV